MLRVRALRQWLGRAVAAPAATAAPVAAAPAVPVRVIFRRFWPYAKPFRRWFGVTLLLLAVPPAIDTLEIGLFKVVVDHVLVPHDFHPFLWIAAAFFGLTILRGAVSFFDDYLSTWVGERFLLSLRTSFFRHLQGLSLDFFERRRLGDVLQRLTGDIASIENFVLSGVASTISYVLRICFFGAALFYLRWDLALVSLVVAPIFWRLARRFSRLIKEASREKRRRSGSISAVAEESLSNAALVQAFNRQSWEEERFHRENVASYEATMASTRLKALFSPLVDLVDLTGAMVVIGLGTWELSRGRLSLGGLLAFLAFLSQLYSPIKGLSRLTNTIHSATAGAERVIEFLDQSPLVVERPGARALRRARGEVEFDGVSFAYPGTDRCALEDVSLAVAPGEMLALVGPSGAGKSTVAKLLLRFYDPDRGAVRLDGNDLRNLTLESLRENVALLLQEALVFDGTIRENIAYGRVGATDDDIRRAARAAGVESFVETLPHGYDTAVGQKGRRLSGGQRQRVAIARAMIREAPVLVLDEPTTGLDAEAAADILEPLRRLTEGRTTIVISHNLLLARDATAILVLDRGRVAEAGTHDELLRGDGVYARLYRLHDAALRVPAPVG